MDRNSTNDCTKVRNLDDATQNRELTEAELDFVSGGATGRRIEMPVRIPTPVGNASAI